jgi:putative pyruvate formate lyase activating enzyme
MAQYAPRFQAHRYAKLQHCLTAAEYEQAQNLLESLGFLEYWVQELDSSGCYFPDFTKEEPFQNI